LAAIARSLGGVAEGRRWLAKGLAGARKLGDDDLLDAYALEDAMLDRAQGRFPRAIAKLSAFLRRYERERDWQAAGFVLWALGGARRFAGDLAGSERDFDESLRHAKRAGDPAGQAYALFGLGGVTRIRGRLKDSERHYRDAGRRLARTDDVFGKAYAECGLANSLRQQGRWAEARGHYRRSHGLYSSLGDAVDLAYVDWGLGQVALKLGDLREAGRRLEGALRAFSKANEERGIALSRTALASLWHATGRTRAAEKLFDLAVRDGRRAGLHAHLETFT
jgi:tetratricopeptide (TPR) repeat protein